MRIYFLLAMAAGASLVGAKCGGTGVGAPCVPEDEYLTGFSGFSQSEVNVESRSFQCETRVCLVNHFQGRVSCPYGQVENPSGSGLSTCMGTIENRNSPECQPSGGLHRDSCQVPSRDGSAWEDRIIPPVLPQLVDRQAADAVYCSCRCGGVEGADDSGATYCECPSGFVCEPLVEDLGLGKEALAGSYCVKEGTTYDPGAEATQLCDSTTQNCNSDYTLELQSGSAGTNQKRACVPPGGTCRDGDSCCDIAQTECIDDDTSPEQNCFPPAQRCEGGSTGITDLPGPEGLTVSTWCQHMTEDENGNMVRVNRAQEILYSVSRETCKEGDSC